MKHSRHNKRFGSTPPEWYGTAFWVLAGIGLAYALGKWLWEWAAGLF